MSQDGGETPKASGLESATPSAGKLTPQAVDQDAFRLLVDNLPTLCWIANGDGYITWYNRRCHEYCGTTPADMEGWGWQRVHDPAVLPSVMERWTAAIANGEFFEMIFPLRSATGAFRNFLTRIEPLKSETGEATRWFGVHTDVQAQIDAETTLRALTESLERRVEDLAQERSRLWKVSPDMLGVLNADGFFETTNPAWQLILGWPAEKIQATNFLDFIHPDDLEKTHAAWAVVNQGHPVFRFENRYRRKSGDWCWLSWVVVPEDDKFYCTARDITAEKEQATELAALQEKLRQSQKMEAVGQLTGGIAHDFNNLLTGISGSLERMQTRIAEGRISEIGRYVNAAQGAAERAAALTHRLLAFSRRQTLDPKPVNVNRLIADMEGLVSRAAGPQVALEIVGAAGLWSTLVDPNQLENALLNLCINARDAMPDGGRITIETANKWLDDRAGKERDLPPGQYISLCVTDTGTGMTREVSDRAFDPFFTTKPLGVGTGLGLSMIYGFVRQSGGQVRIYSELGVGTTMCMYLPRHTGEAEDADAVNVTPDAAPAQLGETVLVVDDEPTVRMLITEVLQEAGYAVIEAEDGAAGLTVVQSGARVDLLITDVGLPGGMNGRQMADAARVVRPGLKVLFITGYAENAVVGNGHLDAGMAILTKPFAMEALGRKVEEIMAAN